MEYPPIPNDRAEDLLAAIGSPVRMPSWYLRQWHFHPDGYLSEAGIRWYDRAIRHLYNWPSERAIHQHIARVVERSRSRSVLDAGCGTGRLLATLTGKGRRLRLFGIDLSPTMLGKARERLRSHDGPMLLEQGDLLGLPTSLAGDEPVDCMVLMHVLGHVPGDVGEAIAERAERFVKPRGYVVVVDHAWHRPRAALSRMVLLSSRRFRGGAITVRVYRTPGAEPAQRQWAT